MNIYEAEVLISMMRMRAAADLERSGVVGYSGWSSDHMGSDVECRARYMKSRSIRFDFRDSGVMPISVDEVKHRLKRKEFRL